MSIQPHGHKMDTDRRKSDRSRKARKYVRKIKRYRISESLIERETDRDRERVSKTERYLEIEGERERKRQRVNERNKNSKINRGKIVE